MRIEAIEPLNRNKVVIILDSNERFVLYKGELRLLNIKGAGELSDEAYGRIVSEILPKRAKLRAMYLLKARDYTEQQLRRKLTDSGYPASSIDTAIDYVRQYGYVNDIGYAMNYIEQERTRRNRREIEQKLLTKGISSEVIAEAFCKIYGDPDASDCSADERSVIRGLLSKKGYRSDITYEDRQKMLAYFYRKGFSVDLVRSVMNEFDDNSNLSF